MDGWIMTAPNWPAHELRPQQRALPDPQHMTSRTLCRCGSRDGWGRLENQWDNDTWVCVRCGGPSAVAEEMRMGLAYFRGGPLDGKAYEVAQLTTDVNLGPYIVQYNWTPEVITSERTQKTARVWVHKELPDERTRQVEAAAQLPPPQPVAREDDPVQEGAEGMAGKTREANQVSTTGLRERREKLGASRTDIEKLSGLTVPMIARIEKGGPSTKQDEADKYAAALDSIEKNGVAKKTAAPRGKKTAAAKPAGEGDTGTSGHTGGSQAPTTSGPVQAPRAGINVPPAPAPDENADTGGVVRLHEWNGHTFTPRTKGDMSGGSPVKWSKSPSASFTFVAFTRDANGKEVVDLWETRRRRIRYANPEDVSAPKPRRRKAG